MTVIVATLKRGGGGTSPFPASIQEDLRLAHVSRADLTARDAIPEWARVSRMTCFVISEQKTYRLGTDLSIAGQVWTEEPAGANVQTRDEKNQPNGYVGLNSDGVVDPQYIRSIYAQDYYTADDEAARFALTARTGDICHQLDNNNIYIKKNNNTPPTTALDWADITVAATVTSVNGLTGVVQIDLDTLLSFGNSATQFETAVGNTTAVNQLAGQIANNDTDIADLFNLVNGLIADDTNTIPLWDIAKADYAIGNNVIYDAGGTYKNLYRCIQVPPAAAAPTDTQYWERIGDFFTRDEITALLATKADLDVTGKVPLSQIPTAALQGAPALNIWYVNPNGDDVDGQGTIQEPYQTIGKAINESADGDTIYINSGSYGEGIAIPAGESRKIIGIVPPKTTFSRLVELFESDITFGAGSSAWIENISFSNINVSNATSGITLKNVSGNFAAATMSGTLYILNSTMGVNGNVDASWVLVEGSRLTGSSTLNSSNGQHRLEHTHSSANHTATLNGDLTLQNSYVSGNLSALATHNIIINNSTASGTRSVVSGSIIIDNQGEDGIGTTKVGDQVNLGGGLPTSGQTFIDIPLGGVSEQLRFQTDPNETVKKWLQMQQDLYGLYSNDGAGFGAVSIETQGNNFPAGNHAGFFMKDLSGSQFGAGMYASADGYLTIYQGSLRTKMRGLRYISDYPDIDWDANGLLVPHQDRVRDLINLAVAGGNDLNTWYVSKNGNDTTGQGSAGEPYQTIGKAVTESSEGDVIYIRSGTYTETVVVNKDLSFIGIPGGSPVSVGGVPAENPRVTISTVTITTGPSTVNFSGIEIDTHTVTNTTIGATHINYTNCKLDSPVYDTVGGTGIGLDANFSNCFVFGNITETTDATSNFGISSFNSNIVTLTLTTGSMDFQTSRIGTLDLSTGDANGGGTGTVIETLAAMDTSAFLFLSSSIIYNDNHTGIGAGTLVYTTPWPTSLLQPGNWYVNKGGNDTTGDGSSIKPYLTIGKAITEASANDNIFITKGTYSEIVTVNKAVSLIGVPTLASKGAFSPDTIVSVTSLTFGADANGATASGIYCNGNLIFTSPTSFNVVAFNQCYVAGQTIMSGSVGFLYADIRESVLVGNVTIAGNNVYADCFGVTMNGNVGITDADDIKFHDSIIQGTLTLTGSPVVKTYNSHIDTLATFSSPGSLLLAGTSVHTNNHVGTGTLTDENPWGANVAGWTAFRYVDTTNGSNVVENGSPQYPYATLAYAESQGADGDHYVILGRGTALIGASFNSSNKLTVLEGTFGSTTITVDANAASRVLEIIGATFNGTTIAKAGSNNSTVIFRNCKGTLLNLTVDDVEFHNCDIVKSTSTQTYDTIEMHASSVELIGSITLGTSAVLYNSYLTAALLGTATLDLYNSNQIGDLAAGITVTSDNKPIYVALTTVTTNTTIQFEEHVGELIEVSSSAIATIGLNGTPNSAGLKVGDFLDVIDRGTAQVGINTNTASGGSIDGTRPSLSFPLKPNAKNRLYRFIYKGSDTWVCSDSDDVLEATVTLTQAQIQALNTTPITVVAAQGADTVIEINSVTTINNFNTTAFATATLIRLKDTTTGNIRFTSSGSFVAATAKRVEQMSQGSAVQIGINEALVVEADADATGGNAASTIDVIIKYRVINV